MIRERQVKPLIRKSEQKRVKTQCIIKEAKRSSWRTFISKINSNTNPKKILDFLKKITNKNINKPINQLSQRNTKATNEKHIANLIAENFAQVSSTKNYSNQFNSIRIKEEKNKIKFTPDNTESYKQPFTLTELQNSISKSNNSAPGPDKIHYTLIKEFPIISLKYLDTCNNIWISGNIPTIWKQAITIPILKKQKDPTNPTSYRPIALTSCTCKTLKKMINLRPTWFLESNNLLSNLQTGFMAKRSTIDQIVCIETLIKEAFIKKEHLVAVLFDLETAYDTTWPYSIFKGLGLQGRLPIFIKHFLEDRTFQT